MRKNTAHFIAGGRGLIAPLVSAQYWGIEANGPFSSGGGNFYWNVWEATFLNASSADITTGGSVVGTAEFGANPASLAFDKNDGTQCSMNCGVNSGSPTTPRIGYNFGSATTVRKLRLRPSSEGGNLRVVYSNDGTNWTTLVTITAPTLGATVTHNIQ